MQKQPFLFIFLEIFRQEGGIQSYVQDLFHCYRTLEPVPNADVFLLRDSASEQQRHQPNGGNPFESDSLRFHYLQTQPLALGRVRLAAVLVVYLLRQRPQHVFCGHVNLAILVGGLCRLFGIPYTVLTYGKEVWEPLPKPLQRAMKQADQLWTISRYTRDRACEANALNPNQFQLLPCAVDGDRFSPGAKSSELVEKYGLAGSRVLMTVARLWSGDRYKGVDATLRALPAIAQDVPNVRYLIIGRGDDQPRLEKLAYELEIQDRVVFAGFVPTDALVEHYRLADAYVMPSQEGFGIVYLEAMACGVPVIAGDADGSADPLQDGRLGWQVPHRDPDAIAQACIELLNANPVHEPRCNGTWLRQEAIAHFGKAALAQTLATLLNLT